MINMGWIWFPLRSFCLSVEIKGKTEENIFTWVGQKGKVPVWLLRAPPTTPMLDPTYCSSACGTRTAECRPAILTTSESRAWVKPIIATTSQKHTLNLLESQACFVQTSDSISPYENHTRKDTNASLWVPSASQETNMLVQMLTRAVYIYIYIKLNPAPPLRTPTPVYIYKTKLRLAFRCHFDGEDHKKKIHHSQ